jgi:hypothetical protein
MLLARISGAAVDMNPSAPSYEVVYARILKSVPKVVFSATLDRVDWNANLFKSAAVEEARLKEQIGKNLSIGLAALASTLAGNGPIDEYRLYVVLLHHYRRCDSRQ